MKRKKRMRHVRRRLMAGLFCISLLFADLGTVIPAWAKEPVVAEQSQGSSESELDETKNPDEENQEEAVQNPDENNSVEGEGNLDGEDDGSQSQIPDEGNAGGDVQIPDEGNAGDDEQKSDEETDADVTQNPDEEDGVMDDAPEEPDLSEEEELTEAEETDSVSENDLEEQGEVRTLTASGDNIASGSYGDITWAIDANGKLTVEGSGEVGNWPSSYPYRAPWCSNNTRASHIKSAEINVTGMTDASYMFYGCTNLTEINFDGFDTSTVTNMSGMFEKCENLESIDLGQRFDTSSVTNMAAMFKGCKNLKSIDLGQRFDTGSVINMNTMFDGCRKLQNFEFLENFDTKSVTAMQYMFASCYAAGDINLSGWDTSQVTTMTGMFMDCDFDHLILGGSFTTKKVSDLSAMFAWQNNDPNKTDYVQLSEDRIKLKGVDLSWLDLSQGPLLNRIFKGCDIRELDLSRLDTSVTLRLPGLFEECDMTGVDFSDLKTDTITSMVEMFYDCTGTIDLHTLDHENVTDMGGMFRASPSGNRLTSLDLSGLNTTKVTIMNRMFQGQDELTHLDLSGFDVGNVENMMEMFSGCKSLQSLDLSGWNAKPTPGGVIDMFEDCTSLTELDLSGFNFENFNSYNINMGFDTCTSLNAIYTPYNIKDFVNVPLPAGDWYMADGTKIEDNCLPKKLSYSVLIQKGSVPSVSAARMEVSKKKTLYACGETIGADDLTVTYYGTDGIVRKLAEGEYTTNTASLSTAEPGTLELVVTYTEDGKALTGKITLTIAHILSADNTTVTLPAEDSYTYDGTPKTPKPVTVSYTKAAGNAGFPVTLTEGTDYTVSYRNNINAYEYPTAGNNTAAPTVIISGLGEYRGTVSKTFTIKKAAAPDAEEKNVTASQCTQANPKRTVDIFDSFIAYGEKTGYEIIKVDDPSSIFTQTPATTDIKSGILTYSTGVTQENNTASITVRISFANYEDAELTVKITMAAKKTVLITGIIMEESMVYSGVPVSHGGEAVVKTEDGRDVTGQVSLVYCYSSVGAGNGTGQESSVSEAPVNAGSYALTVSVSDDNAEYTGSVIYLFTITKADAVVQAKDLIVPTQKTGGSASVPVEQYRESFGYSVKGLFGMDSLKTEPSYTVTKDEAGKEIVTSIDTSKESTYYIHPSGADAGMNYELTYENGTLTVTDEQVVYAYTVRLDYMGHGETSVKSGIQAGSLLELSANELAPEAEGYLFAGWYKDQTFAKGKEWNFDTDTVQSDLTLYACWLTSPAEDGSGLKLCVQEIPDLTYTGSALKPAVTVYDSDGTTLLKLGKDYTVKYVRNTNAVAVGEDGEPTVAGGTAKVENPGKANEKITDVIGHFSSECPYVVITGKGNYTETVYRNFRILPADIAATGEADNTPLATGFTLKYTDQFEAKANKTAKIVSSFKYKKALKADTDYVLSVQDENGAEVALTQGKLPLNAGNYALIIKGTGNYTGMVRRSLYVADGQKLMKNASVTYTKTVKAESADDLSKGIEQKGVIVKIKGQEIPADNYTIDYAGTNHTVGTATMTLTGKNGYVGSKSVTFKITGMSFSAKTVEVKAYDVNHPDEKDWKASVPYTGKAVTQNKVTLTTKVTQNNPTAQTLTYGEHYNITYKNNIKKGTATMIFTAKPESGYSGSFKKTFKITAQDLSVDMFRKVLADGTTAQKQLTVVSVDGNKKNVTVKWDEDAVHAKNGASLSFILCNPAGMALKQGTDYTVSYKDHKAATKASAGATVITGSKQPIMTVKGKGNYGGTLTVQFQIIPASITSDSLTVSAAQVQKKNGMKLKDFKLKVMDGKAVLKEGTDYTIDAAVCTPEMIKAYADSLDTGTTAPEPMLVLTGIGNYGAKTSEGDAASGTKEISLADYIYVTKLTTKNLKAEVIGDRTYTGQNIEPAVKVSYYKDNNAAQKDGVGVELTNGTDYKVTYGNKNIPAGKKKGSITITGAGIYGGSVTVKFDIEKKQIY